VYWASPKQWGPITTIPPAKTVLCRPRAIEKAQTLAADASESDKAYIAALAKRFPADPKSDLHAAAEQYRDAMGEV